MYPNKIQEIELHHQLSLLCDFYNACIEERESWWDRNKPERKGRKEDRNEKLQYISCESQKKQIKFIRNGNSEYCSVHQRVIEEVCDRVYLSYKAFFKLEGAGIPKFRSKKFYNSMTYNRNGFFFFNKQNCKNKYISLSYGRNIKNLVQ